MRESTTREQKLKVGSIGDASDANDAQNQKTLAGTTITRQKTQAGRKTVQVRSVGGSIVKAAPSTPMTPSANLGMAVTSSCTRPSAYLHMAATSSGTKSPANPPMVVDRIAGKKRVITRNVPGSQRETIPDHNNVETPDDACLEGQQVRPPPPAQVDRKGNDMSEHQVVTEKVIKGRQTVVVPPVQQSHSLPLTGAMQQTPPAQVDRKGNDMSEHRVVTEKVRKGRQTVVVPPVQQSHSLPPMTVMRQSPPGHVDRKGNDMSEHRELTDEMDQGWPTVVVPPVQQSHSLPLMTAMQQTPPGRIDPKGNDMSYHRVLTDEVIKGVPTVVMLPIQQSHSWPPMTDTELLSPRTPDTQPLSPRTPDIEMTKKAVLLGPMSNMATQAQVEANMRDMVDVFGLIKCSLEGVGKRLLDLNDSVMVVNDSIKHILNVFAELNTQPQNKQRDAHRANMKVDDKRHLIQDPKRDAEDHDHRNDVLSFSLFFSLSFFLSLARPCSLSLSLSLSLSFRHTYTHTHSLSLSISFSLNLFLSFTHTKQTHTFSLSLSLSLGSDCLSNRP